MKYYGFLLITIFLVMGCKKEVVINSIVFSTEDTRTINLQALEKQHFIKKSDEPLVYEKQNRDTLIVLEINKNLKVVHSKTWKISIDEIDKYQIDDFFEDHYCDTSNSFYNILKNVPMNFMCLTI